MTVKIVELDALIVGAGFGGVYQLKRLRDEGFNVKLVESGTDYGGIWHWNSYPGARVDSPVPHYQFFSDPDLISGWTWSQRFPGFAELRRYFRYVADKWQLDNGTVFSTLVTGATWNSDANNWTIYTNTDTIYKCQFFLPNTGIAAKRHIPDWKGIDDFQGTLVHSSFWPKEDLDLRGKKIAVIGTGSTGVQITQDLAPIASEFVLFQRTPNLALPMGQMDLPVNSTQAAPRSDFEALREDRKQSFGGFDYNFLNKSTFQDTPEERQKTYEELWNHGDFHFWLATYYDMLFEDKANTEAYNFW